MVDSIFWRRKAAEFLELHDESRPIRAELREDWSLRLVDDGADYSDSSRLRAMEAALDDFRILAESVAIAYDLDAGPEAWSNWVDCLSKEWDYVDMWDSADDYYKQRPDVRGFIADVCKASARFCRKLAIENEIQQPTVTYTKLAGHSSDSSDRQSRAEARRAFAGPRLLALNMSSLDWGKGAVPPVDYNTVRDYLDGNTLNLRTNTRSRLARALNVSPDELPE